MTSVLEKLKLVILQVQKKSISLHNIMTFAHDKMITAKDITMFDQSPECNNF